MLVRKVKKKKDIVQITTTSVNGRRSVDTEMNAESFENSYFPQTKTVFVVQFLKVRC